MEKEKDLIDDFLKGFGKNIEVRRNLKKWTRDLESDNKEREKKLRQLKLDYRCSIASIIISIAAMLLIIVGACLK